MRGWLSSSASWVLLGAAACAPMAAVDDGASSAALPIINGAACSEQEEPTAVAIMVDATMSFGPGQTFDITQAVCTGTLIAPDVVLTAGHCTDPSLLTMGFGEVTRADYYITFEADLSRYAENQSQDPLPIPESAVPVREYVQHPDFDIQEMTNVNGLGNFHDVALMFLAVTIDDVRPEIVINKTEAAQIVAGQSVAIAGWGQQTVTSSPFEPPPAGTVGIKVCGDSTVNEVGEYEIQIGGDSSTTRKCHGDSGGPTYLEVNAGTQIKRRVIGITSHAYDQSDCNKGGADTRVDVWLDWIDAEMTARCDDDSRAWCNVKGIIPASYYDGASEGEGEGEIAEGEGEVDINPPAPNCMGCAATPAEGGLMLALLGLLRRRRR